jgi:hypothetical protein
MVLEVMGGERHVGLRTQTAGVVVVPQPGPRLPCHQLFNFFVIFWGFVIFTFGGFGNVKLPLRRTLVLTEADI